MSLPRLPPGFLEGVRLFNAGQYFEAHEAFEALLDEVEADARWDLLLALIQAAVGYHKCAAGHIGGTRMLGKGLVRLAPFADDAGGVEIGRLRTRIEADRTALEQGVPAEQQLQPPPRIQLVRAAGWGHEP